MSTKMEQKWKKHSCRNSAIFGVQNWDYVEPLENRFWAPKLWPRVPIAIYSYLYLSMGIYNYLQPSIAIYKYIQLYITIYSHLQLQLSRPKLSKNRKMRFLRFWHFLCPKLGLSWAPWGPVLGPKIGASGPKKPIKTEGFPLKSLFQGSIDFCQKIYIFGLFSRTGPQKGPKSLKTQEIGPKSVSKSYPPQGELGIF